MKITIIYDNEPYKKGLKPGWGFSCLVEVENSPRIIFDLGADGRTLLSNMEKLHINPGSIDEVFISHAHADHVGGLKEFLKRNKEITLYAPASFSVPYNIEEIISIEEAQQIHHNIFSTGELKGTEQSLAIKTGDEVVVVVGCSHPGVGNILGAASKFGKPCALIGGLHKFDDFNLIEGLDLVCPAHCTKFKSEIKLQYPNKQTDAEVGRVIQL